ncbi:hypothetical protein WJX84_005681 [Apatococcus fuscideae]|uniref:Uncharacterized protein n=1 Tax=Apatococcus fuscideae TaxID=2026836 RepID=A0AAW1STY8_9CHLO
MEKLVVQQRDGCRRLDASAGQPTGRSHLQHSKSLQQQHALKQGMQAEARPLRHALQLLNQKVSIDAQASTHCQERGVELMRDVELGIRAFQRSLLWRRAHQAGQQLSAADRERLSSPPILPSPFLCHSIPHLQEKVEECTRLVSELERALPASALQQPQWGGSSSAARPKDSAQSLQMAVLNMHDYFVHVAARVAALQAATDAAREAHLGSRRLGGDHTNPFEDADQREAAAAAEAARAAVRMPSASPAASAAPAQSAPGNAPLALGVPGQGTPQALAPLQTAASAPAATPAATPAFGGFGGGGMFGQPGPAFHPAQTPGFGSAPASGGLFGGITPAPAAAGNQSGSRKSSSKRR